MSDLDARLTEAAARLGRPYGMTAEQVIQYAVIGEAPHPDAPADVCGVTDPRRDDRWCVLAPEHPGEGHNAYAPRDGCRTWTEHDRHGAP